MLIIYSPNPSSLRGIGVWQIFTRKGGGGPGMEGGGFIMGGWGIFNVLLYSWQKGANPPYFMKTSSPILSKPLFQILSNPLPHTHSPVTSNPHPHCFFCYPVSLTEWWSCHIWCAILLNDNMDLNMLGLGTRSTLIFVLCNKASSLLQSDT